MRIVIPALILLATTLPSTTPAQWTPEPFPNSFGLFFDDDYRDIHCDCPPGALLAHMVIHLPAMKAISGFEVAFVLGEGDGAITGADFTVPTNDLAAEPEQIRAVFLEPVLAVPGVVGDIIYVGDLHYFGFGFPTEIFAGPVIDATVPAQFGAFDLHAAMQGPSSTGFVAEAFVPLTFIIDENGQYLDENGWLTVPLACGPCDYDKSAIESATWTAVKSTYR